MNGVNGGTNNVIHIAIYSSLAYLNYMDPFRISQLQDFKVVTSAIHIKALATCVYVKNNKHISCAHHMNFDQS